MKKRLHWTQTEKGKKRLEEIKANRMGVKGVDAEFLPNPNPVPDNTVTLDSAIHLLENEIAVSEELLSNLRRLRERLTKV